jgi:16S rRNA (adenine1518-N6/adenine1519-N6)-dimethyltransferase
MQQHFLQSDPIVEALVEAGEVREKQVLEIGAGTGNITEVLVEEAESVVAVEADTDLASGLERRFSGRSLEVKNSVFPDVDLPDFDRCVSNPPFALTREVLEFLGKRQTMSALVLQEEMADRLVADPGQDRYGHLTVKTLLDFVPVKLRTVPSSAFDPEPGVDAAVVKLYPNRERFDIHDRDDLLKLSKALFTHDRKKVRNAFVDARHMLDVSKEEAKSIRDKLPHSDSRVRALTVSEIAEIAEWRST